MTPEQNRVAQASDRKGTSKRKQRETKLTQERRPAQELTGRASRGKQREIKLTPEENHVAQASGRKETSRGAQRKTIAQIEEKKGRQC